MSSNVALDKAVEIAKSSKATITVLYVYHDSVLAREEKMMEQLESAEEDEGTLIFKYLVAKLNVHGVDYDFRTDEVKDEAKAILHIAEDEGYDLIVVGAGVRGSGSIAEKVAAGKKVPVLIV